MSSASARKAEKARNLVLFRPLSDIIILVHRMLVTSVYVLFLYMCVHTATPVPTVTGMPVTGGLHAAAIAVPVVVMFVVVMVIIVIGVVICLYVRNKRRKRL